MKILVTGSNGFIGKNLIAELINRGYSDILQYDLDTGKGILDEYARECNFIYHLAGVNRPKDEKEFVEGHQGFTGELLELLKKHNNKATIVMTSSIQAEKDNPYGLSKKATEDLLISYSEETGSKVFIYRLQNVFGKWCKPNYNSVVATFCHNIANGLDITINDRNTELNLVYIDDVVNELIKAMEDRENSDNHFYRIPIIHTVKLGEIADLIYSFKSIRTSLEIPDMDKDFSRKLYSTYLSYLPTDAFSYPLKMNIDNRGSFTELLRTPEHGQVSVNVSKPGIVKGNHWHHTKNEKFIVVYGEGIIRFRKIDSKDIIEYRVSSKKLEIVDIPPGYTHNIENIGEGDMVTIMWANECFNPDQPDTYFMEV